jgi:uncharacterized small protein (DUF1192 family)
MKLFTAIFVIAGLFGANAMAQTDPDDPNQLVSAAAPDPIDQMSIDECRNNLHQCLAEASAQAENSTALLTELAERMGFASADEMLASDCHSRRGTWSNGECLCASPNSWYTAETEECCVENTRAYERRQDSCLDSDGSYSCRGGCRCPMGTQLLDGRCVGDATTREEITELRIIRDERVPALEAEIARLQAELDRARAQGDTQAERIAALESELAAVRNQLDLLRDMLAAQGIAAPPEPPPVPPAVPLTPPAPFPGTPGAVIDAVGPPAPNPVIPPPAEGEETDETWCEANPGWCTLVVIGSGVAAAGLGLGICAAAGCFDEEPHDRIYY